MLETPSDHELASAYRAGDERAAAELVRRHAPALGRYLYSSGAAPDEIEDLVQEALFRAFQRLDGWRGEASFRSWLFAQLKCDVSTAIPRIPTKIGMSNASITV